MLSKILVFVQRRSDMQHILILTPLCFTHDDSDCECFPVLFFPSWLTTPKREILTRKRWKWPVFGWRYVSAARQRWEFYKLCHSECKTVDVKSSSFSPRSHQEKDLVPKLFKVLAPRFESHPNGYTRMARIPCTQNLDRAKMAVLEYKGNPFPPIYPTKKQNELTLINQLLKGYREERAQLFAAKS